MKISRAIYSVSLSKVIILSENSSTFSGILNFKIECYFAFHPTTNWFCVTITSFGVIGKVLQSHSCWHIIVTLSYKYRPNMWYASMFLDGGT